MGIATISPFISLHFDIQISRLNFADLGANWSCADDTERHFAIEIRFFPPNEFNTLDVEFVRSVNKGTCVDMRRPHHQSDNNKFICRENKKTAPKK